MLNLTNKAIARMCGYLAYEREGRWAWYSANWGKESSKQWFDTEDDAYFHCVVAAGLVKL